MAVGHEPEESVEGPTFKVPFSAADRELLTERAPQVLELLDLMSELREETGSCGSLGSAETLSVLRALELAGRFLESVSTDMLSAYRRMGDSAAHGYRTTEALLAGEFRITPREARRRTNLSDQLSGRISESGELLKPVRPAIAENFAEGRISADEARALCDAVDSLPPTAAQMYADRVEKTLVELAPTVQLKDFPKLCNRIIQHIDPDGALPSLEPEPHKYNVTLAQQRNGDWRLRGLLSCPTGTTLHALLYGRMKDADVPVTVRPHRTCNAEDESAGGARDGRTTGVEVDTGAEARAGAGSESGAGTGAEAGASATEVTRSGTGAGAGSIGGAVPVNEEAVGCREASMKSAPSGPPADDAEYSVPSAVGNHEMPKVPLEALWESTRVRVHADARVEINGVIWTLTEDEPQFVLSETGWPALLPERIFHEVQKLLTAARQAEQGEAESVLWEKVLGRRPAGPDAEEPPQESSTPDHDWVQYADSGATSGATTSGSTGSSASAASVGRTVLSGGAATGDGAPFSGSALPNGGSVPHGSSMSSGVPTPSGVFSDGSRSDVFVDFEETAATNPGVSRHDRFAFLLRCVARERVLHGADHALVITARPDDLTKPRSILTTHTGSPVGLAATEQWSNAAQTFLHLLDEGGRTVRIRSQGRFATRSQMAVLAARDQGCTFPDCDAPAEWCEAHHIVAWARGGETAIDNLTLLCPFHHRWFEKSGWDGTFLNGLPAWVPPAHIDRKQRPLFHSRFRVALLNLPPELPLNQG